MESGVYAVDWDIRVFWNGGMTPGVPLDLQVETSSLVVRWERRDSFPGEAVKWTLISRRGGKKGLFLNCFRTLGIPRVETGMSGNFLNCLKDVKDPFVAQEGRWN